MPEVDRGVGSHSFLRTQRGSDEPVAYSTCDVFASYGSDAEDRARAQAIVDHELGHVVGLGHVDDPGELMYEENLGRTTYGPGDREGLARLGSVDCW